MPKMPFCFEDYSISYPILLLLFQCTYFTLSQSQDLSKNQSFPHRNETLCGDFDIRRPSSFSRIESCTVIEGNLLIVMTRLPPDSSIPNLREITGFLVLYDLTGLDGLANLFPKLTIIRGRSLISNFALVIRSTTLKTIGLPSLRVIQRGGVRVELNTNLCYVRTVNWSYILGNQTSAAAPIRLLSNRLICPDTCQSECASPTVETRGLTDAKAMLSPEKDTVHGHCWSSSHCQSICSSACINRGLACHMNDPQLCCHEECIAGCYGPGPENCVACKGALHRGICVAYCPPGTYLFHGRRCVTAEECFDMTGVYRQLHVPSGISGEAASGSTLTSTSSGSSSTPTVRPHAIHQGRCVLDCPAGHQRDENSGECVPCGDKCPRIHCLHMLITSLKSLSKLKDCYSVTDLYISIHEGDPVLIQQQLDEAFSSLREVEFIKVVRATALTSLSFLRHITRLNVSPKASRNVTVIEIRGNDNLVELWPPPAENGTGGLQVVSEGLVYFILNRYLCPKKITDLVRTGALRLPGNRYFRSEELEIAEATNGKMGFCETTQMSLELKNVYSSTAVIQWSRFFSVNPIGQRASTLVLVFYQATTRNLTVYSNRLSCSEDSWKMIPSVCNTSLVLDARNESAAFCSKTLTNLQPATRYAVYVESKTLFSQRGAISNIIYFTTTASNPSYPRLEELQAMNNSCIHVKWSPPQYSNGQLAVYLLWYRIIRINTDSYFYRDFCFMTPDWLSSINPPHYIGTSRLTGIYWSYANILGSFCPESQCCYPASQEYLWTVDERDKSLPVLFGNRLARTLKDNEVGLFVVNVDSGPNVASQAGKPILTSTLSYLRSFSQYVVELQACQMPPDGSDLPWTNFMEPDSPLEIEMTDQWRTYLSRYCSQKVFKTQRTLPAVGVDNVDNSAIFSIQESADTVRVLWAEPPNPNGVILYYVLRYRRAEQLPIHSPSSSSSNASVTQRNKSEYEEPHTKMDSSSGSPVWSTLCVSRASWQALSLPTNTAGKILREKEIILSADGAQAESGASRYSRSVAMTTLKSSAASEPDANMSSMLLPSKQNVSVGGAELLNLLPGFYELQIMAVSLAGNSSWTPSMVFEVVASPMDTIITVTAICASIIAILLALIVVCIIHRIRKKRLMDSEWNSPNPEYWHVYEVDDWEMQLEDIDILNFHHPLGRGNFGMVYRGMVKTLRTPANCFYTDPHNIAAAIKTLSSTSTVFDRRDFITEACYMKQFQSFHIVRLFGIVSKCSPSSAVAVAARAFRSGGGSGSGSGGGVAGNSVGMNAVPQPNCCFFFCHGSRGAFCRRHNRPNRQAVPVPVKRKSHSSHLGEETASTAVGIHHNAGNNDSLNRSVRLSSNESFKSCNQQVNANGTSNNGQQTKHNRLRGGSFGRRSFSCLLKRTQRDEPTGDITTKADEKNFAAAQHCSSSDSIRPFSNNGMFVVMELMERGDLASYLRKLGDSGIGFVKPVQAYLWAVQIADGMAYLERKKYVHRDLAARNCLVDGRGVVKVGDFGLCRDIYERNYYHKVGAGKLPVRWMAPESIQSAYFTSRSDVWSFGVVLWEIATMACLPYQGMSHNEVISYVLEGNTLVSGGAPINCPPLLQSVMLYCWSYRPTQRPSFLNLLCLLAPRFADADFRQASYFYVGDTFTQQPPPYQDFEKSISNSSTAAAAAVNAEISDLPSLIKTVLGPPHGIGGSGGSNSLSEDFPQVHTDPGTDTISTFHFCSSSPQLVKEERQNECAEEALAPSDPTGDCSSAGDSDV